MVPHKQNNVGILSAICQCVISDTRGVLFQQQRHSNHTLFLPSKFLPYKVKSMAI